MKKLIFTAVVLTSIVNAGCVRHSGKNSEALPGEKMYDCMSTARTSVAMLLTSDTRTAVMINDEVIEAEHKVVGFDRIWTWGPIGEYGLPVYSARRGSSGYTEFYDTTKGKDSDGKYVPQMLALCKKVTS